MLGSAVLLNLLLIFSVVEAAEFTITLDAQDKFNVTWSYDGTSKDDYITFTVSLLLSCCLYSHFCYAHFQLPVVIPPDCTPVFEYCHQQSMFW